MPRLRGVVRQRPVDEILYGTGESDVVVDRVVVISRAQERSITSVDTPRIALHAVEDLGSGFQAGHAVTQFDVVVIGHPIRLCRRPHRCISVAVQSEQILGTAIGQPQWPGALFRRC